MKCLHHELAVTPWTLSLSALVIVAAVVPVGVQGVPGRVAQPAVEVLHSFTGRGPTTPRAPLIRGTDGNFYGTTFAGGAYGRGTVFRLTPDGIVTVLHAFGTGSDDGTSPDAGLVQAIDGNFYGTTYLRDTIFRTTPAGVTTTLHTFTSNVDGQDPSALIQATDGNFYGTTRRVGDETPFGDGVAFKMTPSGTFTVLRHFYDSSSPGGGPSGLIQASDGNLYGTTSYGRGANLRGAIFRMTAAGGVTILYNFEGTASTNSALIPGTDGYLYGMRRGSGTGSVFRMTLAGAFTNLHTFTSEAGGGYNPYGSLLQGIDGRLYGTTLQGGASNQGTIFGMTVDGTDVTVLHSFSGGPTDGAYPRAGLIQAADGRVHGTSDGGGASNLGTAFAMDLDGTLTVVSFGTGRDGEQPQGTLIEATNGKLYGTTQRGGASDVGTIFRVTPNGVLSVVHAFAGGATDGANILGGLIQATDGGLYGTTKRGGAFQDSGTVFRMSLEGDLTVLHSFEYWLESEGAWPEAGLLQAADKNFYGTTWLGNGSNRGTVFRMTPDGALTFLHIFQGWPNDGLTPLAGLIQGTDGNLYGTTGAGGTLRRGTVFKMTPTGTVTVLHAFAGAPTDGGTPYAALIQAADGNFYGTTTGGGASNNGTAFRMTPDGRLTILHAFAGGPTDGAHPYAALIQSNGNFYGTTYNGGAANAGTVFTMSRDGAVKILHSFTRTDGAHPFAALLPRRAERAMFYGTTMYGGASGGGTVFRLDLGYTPFVDDALTPGFSLIRAVHITELRSRIDALRARFDLAGYPYTDPAITAGATTIRVQHILDLRSALAEAHVAAGLTPPSYTDPDLGAGTMIKLAHIAELRAGVVAIE